MALIVEDGTGLANADSFITLEYANTYHTTLGNSTWTGTDADKEAAIRRATAFMSESYTWQGIRTHGRDQALAWPRSGVIDQEGWGIESDEIPVEIKKATAEVALREIVTPGAMNPDFTASDLVKREKIGPLETEYALTNTSADAQRPILLVVRDMISQFLAKGGGNALAGSSYRV